MGKLSKNGNEMRELQAAYFKWEFLRRNALYQKDYSQLFAVHAKTLKRMRYPALLAHAQATTALVGNLERLHYKWGVGFMQNPKHSTKLDALIKSPNERKKNPFWRIPEFSVLVNKKILNWDTVHFYGMPVDLRLTWEWLPLVVNLNCRPETIIREIITQIDKAKSAHVETRTPKIIGGEAQNEKATTPAEKQRNTQAEPAQRKKTWMQLAQRDCDALASPGDPNRLLEQSLGCYLHAWKLKQEGFSVQQIAREMGIITDGDFQGWDSFVDQEAVQRKVRRYVQHAKQLIAGDYRLIP